jgi:hypothetical protein
MEPGVAGGGGPMSPLASLCGSDTPSSEATHKDEIKNNLQGHLKNMELYKEQTRFAKKHRKIIDDLRHSEKTLDPHSLHYLSIDAATYTTPYNIAYSSNISQTDL